jgi:hypothetical protein
MQYFKWLIAVFFSVVLIGCNAKPTEVKIMFVEQEPGVEPYQTRLIVTPDFMRFDDGEGSIDFVLFDRKKEIIYSTNSGEETVMSVEAKKTEVQPPFELKQSVKNLGMLEDAPKIQNETAQHYQFMTNGKLCYEVVAVKGLMPDVVKAMQAFQKILESDSKLTFNTIPADMHNACDMSMSTFAAGQHLEYGFPIQEWTPDGTGRALVDFDDKFKADKKLFQLPENYQLYSVQDFREGKVKFEN